MRSSPPPLDRGPLISLLTCRTSISRPPRGSLVAPFLAITALLLASCASPGPAERFVADAAPSSSEGLSGLTYWSEGDESLQLDACPVEDPPAEGVAAVILVHGGGFTSGDRDDPGVKSLCAAVAGSGAAAFAISYRLSPEHLYPAQLDDLAHAVEWVRDPAQVERFSIDPTRVGVIGSSAGAILAQQLATRGDGPLDQGSRVKAVASLSGVSQMGPEGATLGRPSQQAADVVLGYFGCEQISSCPQAAQASPADAVDPSDPPMLLVNGSEELVPVEQAEAMGSALERAGVDHQVVIVPGSQHGLALLDPVVRDDITSFMREKL